MDTTGAAAGDLQGVTRDLLEEWGVVAARIRPVVLALAAGRWHTIGDLVRDHGVSRRTVERLAAALDPWIEQQGGRLRVRDQERAAVLAEWTPPACTATAPQDVERTMADLMRGLPPSDRGLDHVPATPATAVRRAHFLAETFDLAGASVLCLGDHDLTSLALAQLCPAAEIAAVDVDERLLGYIGRVAEERGWRVRPLFADLRVEVPPSVREACDLLFTDPPYTPAGAHLFLVRGLAALRRRDASRAVFCYGYGERQPALGLKAQAEYHRLHLLAEAILPGFNRYAGAEALGAASSLYVCRPTRRTWAALARARPVDPRIYSQGESAETSRLEPLPQPLVERVRRATGEDRPLLVGERWLPDLAARCETLALARYLEDVRARGGRPPFTGPPHGGVVAVDLHPHFGGYLPRLLLTAAARRLVAVVSAEVAAELLGGPLAALVGVRYRAAHVPGEPSLVVADRLDAEPEDRVGRTLHRLLDRPAATLGSAWREALIGAMAAEGRTLTKNGARAAIAATATGRLYGRCHLSELPLDRLCNLAEEVASSLESL
ncbi:MAG TPA: bis-aminopropyl spermidine synthase family protein [Candidatus Dormibacteraeota bacterium]|nr:bis-aminopropyl spermidine synthase family protein [Candidatus Dormibacteraeota bacterium]